MTDFKSGGRQIAINAFNDVGDTEVFSVAGGEDRFRPW